MMVYTVSILTPKEVSSMKVYADVDWPRAHAHGMDPATGVVCPGRVLGPDVHQRGHLVA